MFSNTMIPDFGMFNILNAAMKDLMARTDSKAEVKEVTEIVPSCYNKVDDTGLTLVVELPGVKKEDVSATLDGRKFSICAPRDLFGKKVTYSLDLKIGAEFDDTKPDVNYADGVFTLKLPKRGVSEPRKLTIQ